VLHFHQASGAAFLKMPRRGGKVSQFPMDKVLLRRIMMKKKLVLGVCMGAMMFSLAACGSGDGGQDSSASLSNPTEQSDSTNQPSSTGQPDSADQSSDNMDNVGDGTGIGTVESWSEEMAGIKAAVQDALGDEYWPDMALDSEMLQAIFNISPEMYEDYMAEMPMISNNVDTLVIVKAKEDQADAVEAALTAYRDVLVNDSLQYPMNVGKVQASSVERIGNYVLFVQLGGDTMGVLDDGDDAVVTKCQEANALVISTIRQKIE